MKKRNSSIELMRIICMIAIILHHYIVHGGFDYGEEITNIEIVLKVISSFGKIASNIFILISGYFLINSKWKIQKAFCISIKTLTIFGSITLLFALLTKTVFSLEEICTMFFDQWFIRNYIILYCCYPIINRFLKKLNREQYLILVITLLVLWSIMPTILLVNIESFDISTFFIMYVLGGYIRLYTKNNSEKKEKIYYGIISTIVFLIVIITIIIIMMIGQKYGLLYMRNVATFATNSNSILTIIASVTIFRFSINVNFYNSKINYIATSLMGVYLIHDNSLVRNFIWKIILPNADYLNSNWLILHMMLKSLVVFIVCIIIDKIINKILTSFIDSLRNILENKKFIEIKKE